MKYLKTLLALLLALFLVVGCSQTPTDPVTPDEPDTEEPDTEEPDDVEKPDANTLVVGTGGDLNGHFIAGISSSSYDKWVRNLLWDYGTVVANEKGQFVFNETVLVGEPEIVENEDGSKTYTFTINEGLKWNTGEEITAKDFVFDMLFNASPEYFSAGASQASGSYDSLVGQAAYQKGEVNHFEGVKLIDDTTFSVTIDASQLPYFYELALVAVGPAPMFHWTPNLDISADGNSLVVKEGYEITDEDIADFVAGAETQLEGFKARLEKMKADLEEALEEDPEYNTEEDDKAIADQEASIAALEDEIAKAEAQEDIDVTKVLLKSNAYEIVQKETYAPTVTSGAYAFLVHENKAATVELNPNYAGDFKGDKPVINRVQVRTVNEELDVDMVINGEIDIAPGVIEEEKIQNAEANQDKVSLHSYPRNGYGVLAFKANKEPTNLKEVRHAVAFLLDRNAIVQGSSGGYGVVGQGHYGLAQWMYVTKGEEFLDAVEARGTAYTLDVNAANDLLDQTPYVYEADGVTPWDAAKAADLVVSEGESFDYFRHKADGTILEINQTGASKLILDLIAGQMPEQARYAGMKYTTQLIDFNILLEEYYNLAQLPPEDLTYHAFSLGTSFTAVYDPFYSYHSSLIGTGYNVTETNDPTADELVVALRQTDPEDTEGYAEKWLEFQLWYNDYLPDIPLYSQEYFDIVNNRVTGLDTYPVWDWSQDIADLRISE